MTVKWRCEDCFVDYKDDKTRCLCIFPQRTASSFKKGRALSSKRNGAPEEIRTPDRSVRSRLLYPAELRVHHYCDMHLRIKWRSL